MEWIEKYPQDKQPTFQQIDEYIQSDLWAKLNEYLQKAYETAPKMSYSSCSGQPGWNVKYQKGGKSLCTLYPLHGQFIALVVVGNKEEDAVQELLTTCCPYLRDLYAATPFSAGGRWLMIHVTDADILSDVIQLISLRVRPKHEVSL